MPVYNEGATIEATVGEFYEKILKEMPHVTLFIFEDGSRDDTKEKLQGLSANYDRVIVSTCNERKGYPRAVRDAIGSVDEAQFKYVLFTDSDGQYNPADFHRLSDIMMNDSADIVMAQRKNRAEPYYRIILSSGLRVMEKLLFNPTCTDITSAFRLMKTSTAKSLASKVRFSKYNFWLEFTARGSAEGVRITEVPVVYRSRKGQSNVYSGRRMPGILFNEFGAVLRTWWEYKGKEISKFAVVGLSGAIVILVLTYVLTEQARINYLLSTAIAIEASIIWAFILNDSITFKGRKRSYLLPRRLLSYNALSLGGLAINESILFLLVFFGGFYYLLGEVIAIIITFCFNYLASIKWAWPTRA